MEVGTTYNLIPSAANTASKPITAKSANPEVVLPFLKQNPPINQKSMMDLEDVQRFLYMLIGSEIKVEPENSSVGNILNEVA